MEATCQTEPGSVEYPGYRGQLCIIVIVTPRRHNLEEGRDLLQLLASKGVHLSQ